LSSTLIKSYSINYGAEKDRKEKRIIDSNQAVSDRIKELSEMLEVAEDDDGFADEFTEGLDAAQVDALLADQDEAAAQEADNEEIEKVLEEAREQAQQIIDDANEQAQQIINDANSQAQSIFDEARANGEAEGNEKGYAEGLARAEEKEREVEEKAAALSAEYEELVSELEPKMVDTLTGIYSHVFGIDLAGRNDIVFNLLKDTIRNIDSVKNYLVHVSKDDHEYVLENRDELTAGLGSSVTVEVIEDVTLTAGNCFIETEGGIFDCSLGTELELLKKELKILSYNGN